MAPSLEGGTGPATNGERLRGDLAVVAVDDDLVVYEPVEPACHVLTGGAVIVWLELEGTTTRGLIERVCDRVARDVDELAPEIEQVLDDLRELGLLERVPNGADVLDDSTGTGDDQSVSDRLTLPEPPAP